MRRRREPNPPSARTRPPEGFTAPPERLLERLEWKVLRRLDGHFHGDYRTLFRGDGVDVADLREYQPGDDVRHIDWNVTARLDVAHVRQFSEDRELTAWFVCDRSASMFTGTGRTKAAAMADVVATLARLLIRDGSRVGALLWNNQLETTLTPAGTRQQILHMVAKLQAAPDPIGTQQSTDLAAALQDVQQRVRRRSLVFVLSDFVSEPGWERPLQLLSRHHDVVAIRLTDRRDNEVPDAGTIVFADAETGEQLVVDTSDPVLRSRLAALVDERELALQKAMSAAGVLIHDIAVDDDLVAALVSLVAARQRQSRGAPSRSRTG